MRGPFGTVCQPPRATRSPYSAIACSVACAVWGLSVGVLDAEVRVAAAPEDAS
jgi:hypothetical protein